MSEEATVTVGLKLDYSEEWKKGSPENCAEVSIKLYHDVPQRIIYLQLSSIEDPSVLVAACKHIQGDISLTGQHQYWQTKEHQYFAALLFIFSVCHIVLVCFPTPRFDLSYLRLFKLLASVRHSMLPHICGLLSSIEGIPEIWKTTGRPCIPRIIVSFQVPWMKEESKSNEASLSRIQHSLQEQIHYILKKNRLLGSLSSSSLFTVSSPNPTFVHVQAGCKLFSDPAHWCINRLLKNSVNVESVIRSLCGKGNQSSFLSQPPNSPAGDHSLFSHSQEISFQDFVNKQIDYMMTVESRDIPVEGRRGTHVEAPLDSLWYKVCAVLFDFFLGNENDVNNLVTNMAPSLDYDWKFSENRCRKVIPLATNAYLDNLPSHYTHSVHLQQLSQALHVYTLNARGPAFEHYIAQLQEDCNQIWWNGRQLCEIRSLTGQPCVYPFHRIPDGKDMSQHDDSAGIPCKPHSSRVTSVAACNCGRIQGTREDPFDLKVANYEFYQELERKCCSYLVHLRLPTHEMDEAAIAKEKQGGYGELAGHESSQTSDLLKQETGAQEGGQMSQNIATSVAFTLSNKDTIPYSEPSINDPTQTGLSIGFQFTAELTDMEIKDDIVSVYSAQHNEGRSVPKADNRQSTELSTVNTTGSLGRRISFTEYTETMISEDSPPGLLPLFSSWNLLCLGSASLYNPQKGIEQHGFFSGNNFLLPWEIKISDSATAMMQKEAGSVIKDGGEEQWPAPGEVSKSRGTSTSGPGVHLPIFQTVKKLRSLAKEIEKKDTNEPLAKVSTPTKPQKGGKEDKNRQNIIKAYIGIEYECPRGHRFFCSSPERIAKASTTGHLRDTASKLLQYDMPMYFPCPCRAAKPLHLAQLSRSYIVTPDSCVGIRINPRVQPGEDSSAPVFSLGSKNGVCLPRNSFCVLKFPYVYMDESGPYLPPHDAQSLPAFRLLKDMYNYCL
eukprot:gene6867-12467_t